MSLPPLEKASIGDAIKAKSIIENSKLGQWLSLSLIKEVPYDMSKCQFVEIIRTFQNEKGEKFQITDRHADYKDTFMDHVIFTEYEENDCDEQ